MLGVRPQYTSASINYLTIGEIMPSYKPIQDAANAAKKKAEAQKAAYSQVKQNLNKKKIDYATAKKSAGPKSSKPVMPIIGAMPKDTKSAYPKSSKAGPVAPKMGRPLPAAGSGRKVILKKYSK
jgi:hypothetical protein